MKSKNYTKKNREGRLLKKKILKGFTKSLPEHVKQADKLFSKLVRLTNLTSAGVLVCYTCDKPLTYSEAQCGHFISRENLGLRWSLDNARVQCEECNCNKHGNLQEFEKRLNAEIPGLPDQLRAIGREVAKQSKSDILDLMKEMRARIKELEKQ